MKLEDVAKVHLEHFDDCWALPEDAIVLLKTRNDLADLDIDVKQSLQGLEPGRGDYQYKLDGTPDQGNNLMYVEKDLDDLFDLRHGLDECRESLQVSQLLLGPVSILDAGDLELDILQTARGELGLLFVAEPVTKSFDSFLEGDARLEDGLGLN